MLFIEMYENNHIFQMHYKYANLDNLENEMNSDFALAAK